MKFTSGSQCQGVTSPERFAAYNAEGPGFVAKQLGKPPEVNVFKKVEGQTTSITQEKES